MKVLIAEDEVDMQKILRMYLEREGYEVTVTDNGQQAFERLCQDTFDLLIADWMMPQMNGIDLCQAVREYSMPVKIIMLTAKGEVESEIRGLTCGADDYVKKPFEPKLLLLRIQKLFGTEDVLRCGHVTVNMKTQSVFYKGREIRLTQKELLLLQILIKNKGITVSREQLLDRVWGMDYEGDERTLDTHIRRLRKKIGPESIVTHVGIGYRMEESQ